MDYLPNFTIKRVSTNCMGTYGALIYDTIPFAVTLENPWKDNKINISCIPAGQYICKQVKSRSMGWVFEIQNVPGRTYIYFHRGNLVTHTRGCVLVGEGFSQQEGVPAIAGSVRGYREFITLVKPASEFLLNIVWV